MDTEEKVETPETTAENAPDAEMGKEEKEKRKLNLGVEITDTAPCKKHIKITIIREDIEFQFEDALKELRREASVPGFRVGRAPKKLVGRRFRKEVAEKVKAQLVMASMEQLEADHKLKAISQPDLDVEALELPEYGPLVYELDIEVQPEFELPDYKGLVVKRPVRAVTEADVDKQHQAVLERDAQIVPKLEGTAEVGDQITANVMLEYEGVQVQTFHETSFRVSKDLRIPDGVVPNVDKALVGAKPGDHRTAVGHISEGAADAALRGKSINVHFHVLDLKEYRLPAFDEEFLDSMGFSTEEEYREALRRVLARRFEFNQRQAIRQSVLEQLHQRVKFDLPSDLVAREARSVRSRLIKQLEEAGATDQALRAREAEIRANAHSVSLSNLKDFFLLAKIAEVNELKVEPDDIEQEIEALAARSDESPRRVRARLEKSGRLDDLYTQIVDRKVIDHILESATFEDVVVAEEAPAAETLDEAVAPEPEEVEEEAVAAEGNSA